MFFSAAVPSETDPRNKHRNQVCLIVQRTRSETADTRRERQNPVMGPR